MLTNKRAHARWVVLIALLLGSFPVHGKEPTARSTQRVTATLNGFEIVLDAHTGSILRLSSPGAGTMLDTTAGAAGIVDVAYPVEEFGPLRLASRYSRGAQITASKDRVVVHWDELGASRSFVKVPGKVSATVTLKAAEDGKSVIMACAIHNQSGNAVGQVLFPDLLGLVPTDGAAGTELRSGKRIVRPFVQLASPRQDQFFARNSTFMELSLNKKDPALGRWIACGSAKGGLSLFAARGAHDSEPTVMLHLWERNNKLRLMYAHRVDIKGKATWQSGPYWLTPLKGGWNEAMKPYRAWLKQRGNQK